MSFKIYMNNGQNQKLRLRITVIRSFSIFLKKKKSTSICRRYQLIVRFGVRGVRYLEVSLWRGFTEPMRIYVCTRIMLCAHVGQFLRLKNKHR